MPKSKDKSESKDCVFHFRVEPYVKSWVSRTVKNPAIPFSDKSEFLYWCLLEGLKKLKNEHPDEEVLADYAIGKAQNVIDRSIERENACARVMEETRHRVRHLLARQAYDELGIFLRKMKVHMDSLPQTPEVIKTQKQWNLEFGQYIGTAEPSVAPASSAENKPNGKPRKTVSMWPGDATAE